MKVVVIGCAGFGFGRATPLTAAGRALASTETSATVMRVSGKRP